MVHFSNSNVIDSSVNARTGFSPVQMLFGNKLYLNRGIITPHLSVGNNDRSNYVSDSKDTQDEVLNAVMKSLQKANDKILSQYKL